jgi:hypothetical protein
MPCGEIFIFVLNLRFNKQNPIAPMKKALLMFAAVCSMAVANAQCTVDGTNTNIGITPTPQNFPDIQRGVAVGSTHVMQLYLPTSLPVTIPGVTLTVLYLDITNIGGLPTGLSYACNPTNCRVNGGSNGCVALSGTTNDPVGTYPLTFDGTVCANVSILGGDTCLPLSALSQLGAIVPGLPSFSYDLRVANPASARDLNAELSAALSVFPNPARGGNFTVTLNGSENFNGTLAVVNSVGQVVHNEEIEVNGQFRKEVSVAGLPAGLYNVQIKTAAGFATRSIVIE